MAEETKLINVLSKEGIKQVTKMVPFLKGGKVTFYTDVTGNFLQELETRRKKDGESAAGYWSAVQAVADWNFSDEKGKKLVIDVKNFKKLSLKLQRWLLDTSQALVLEDEEKKESPVSSSKR